MVWPGYHKLMLLELSLASHNTSSLNFHLRASSLHLVQQQTLWTASRCNHPYKVLSTTTLNTSRGIERAQHSAGLSSNWLMLWVDASWSKCTEAQVCCQVNARWGNYGCPRAFFSVHVLLYKNTSTVSFAFINWSSPLPSSFALPDFCPPSSTAKKMPLCVQKCPTVHRS